MSKNTSFAQKERHKPLSLKKPAVFSPPVNVLYVWVIILEYSSVFFKASFLSLMWANAIFLSQNRILWSQSVYDEMYSLLLNVYIPSYEWGFILFSYFFITRFCLYLERAGSELPEVLALALAVSGSRTGTSAALWESYRSGVQLHTGFKSN